jgi:tetratricopeptide (TPR) repeat protein
MKFHRGAALILITFVLSVLVRLPAWAQYREYYLSGKVLDTNNQPIAGAEIALRDQATSRGYKFLTKQDGAFRFAGLPHGVYSVSVVKQGFAPKTSDWNFSKTQEVMLKVEIPPIVLVAQTLIEETVKLKEAQGELKDATEKLKLGDADGAIVIINKVLDKNPKDPNALYLLGISRLRKKEYAEAAAALTEVTVQLPKFAGAYLQLGVCYQQQMDREKALGFYQKATELDPNNADILYDAGLMLFELGRVPEALTEFQKGLGLRPDDLEMLEMAGRCYVNQADYPKAVEFLEKAKAGSKDPNKIKFLEDLIVKLKDMIK